MTDAQEYAGLVPLDHATIAEDCVIERYHQGDLPREEEMRFELHFLSCPECQQELEVHRSFVRGLKTTAAQAGVRTAVTVGILAWIKRHPLPTALWCLLGGYYILLLSLYLFSWKGQESQMVELAPSTEQLTPTDGVAEVPVYLLAVLRSGDDGIPTVLDTGDPWILAVDIGDDPRYVSYSITILDAAGETHVDHRQLRPNALEVIQLTFQAGVLAPGEYRLVARGHLADGQEVEIGAYPFRIGDGD